MDTPKKKSQVGPEPNTSEEIRPFSPVNVVETTPDASFNTGTEAPSFVGDKPKGKE